MQLKLPTLSISIVSHLQGSLVKLLLGDIESVCKGMSIEVLLTLNLAENFDVDAENYFFPITIHSNKQPSGFAENHNRAFSRASGQFFCVLNPDIRINDNPFVPLISCFENPSVGVVAPLVFNEYGVLDNNARFFPSPLKILCKALGGCKGSDYEVKKEVIFPDWVGGMFMLFRSKVYKTMYGLNERYFLYYEDVDMCARLRLSGYQVALCPDAKVVHHAQRSSHRSFKYFRWHLASMIRFFCSRDYWRLKYRK
ncbi:glycosyltransferase [uncultured Cycloclasticus sp.]|uniref:glycosyltransferase n=1 Tax=uncultured Cycloclasticus sp. TaxID=172194 RepID=UPI002586FDE9|nr:glycosyltransferase [uncultured Cycloclasticus sp.]